MKHAGGMMRDAQDMAGGRCGPSGVPGLCRLDARTAVTGRAQRTPFAKPRGALTLSLLAGLLMLGSASAAHARASDSAYAAERRALETARYLYEFEGNATAARELLDRLGRSTIPEIRTQARYLRAAFLEEDGKRAQAAQLYRESLEGEGLEPVQKQRAIARLLSMSPASVQPLRDAGKMRGHPARVFEHPGSGGTEYVLLDEAGDGGRGPRLLRQDTQGLLRTLAITLGPDEDILDAAPDRVLTRVAARQRVILRRAPAFAPEVVLERFAADEGALFAGNAGEFVVLGAQGLRALRAGQVFYEQALSGAGCSWHPAAPRARQGVVFCPGQGVYRADFARRAFAPIPLGGEPPADVQIAGEYLALRYADHVEIRRGPAFDAFLWGFPSSLQDPVALGRGHAFLAAADGSLRAFVLRTGQLDWQRDDGAALLRVHGGELFVLTHARALLALDERGRLLYSYEPGWDGEPPHLLPGKEWLVVHNADGRRVRLNRELLRLTGGSRDHLLRGERESLARGDTRAALRELDAVLALEPGHGVAWREKARLLEASGAPRNAQTMAWLQAARSQSATPWSDDAALTGLANGLGASWIWKRQPGPRFFPSLTGGRNYSFYVENDNQTLVVLNNRDGSLKANFRFPEGLDLKVALWMGDTLAVSSAARLYLMAPARSAGLLAQMPLPAPVCHAVMTPRGLVLSDWSGNVRLVEPATGETRWEARPGRGGLLLAQGSGDQLDVFEIEGGWHRLRLGDGKMLDAARMPPGTITEVHAGGDFAYAGYDEGLVVAVDRAQGNVAWQRDVGEQIFSLSGRADQTLLVGTSSKRVLSLNGRTGNVQAQANVASHLFNRPLLVADGYWIGTTEPALEKRSLTHEVLRKYPLPDMPGTPTQAGGGIAVSTLDNFILVFPAR